jgi:hypothetical protein
MKRNRPTAEQISDAIKSTRGNQAIVDTDLQAELAATLHRLLPKAERAANRGKPALLRLITRYAQQGARAAAAARKKK